MYPHCNILSAVNIWPAAGQHFEKLNDQQFEIHTHMRTGDLLALRFFLFPAGFSCHQMVAARQTE